MSTTLNGEQHAQLTRSAATLQNPNLRADFSQGDAAQHAKKISRPISLILVGHRPNASRLRRRSGSCPMSAPFAIALSPILSSSFYLTRAMLRGNIPPTTVGCPVPDDILRVLARKGMG